MKISPVKKVIYAVFGTFFFAVLILLAAELFVRICIHFRYGVAGKKYGIYIADKELGAVHRPNSYNTNSVMNNRGFRNSNDILGKKLEGALRIYCSGGSTVFCYNVSTDESWPSVLQYKLRQAPGHEKDEVLNAGEICFSVSHEFAFAKRFIPILKPNIVILYGFGTNESSGAIGLIQEGYDLKKLSAEKKWGIPTRRLDQGKFWKRNSVLIKLFDYEIKNKLMGVLTGLFRKKAAAKSASTVDPWFDKWVIENFEHTLRAYIRFLHSNGCRVVLVRWGDSWGLDKELYAYFIKYFLPLRELGVKIGKEEGATICDFASVVEQQPQRKQLFIASGVHLTSKGVDLFTETIIATLKNSFKDLW